MKNKELVGGQYNPVVTMETRAKWKAPCGKHYVDVRDKNMQRPPLGREPLQQIESKFHIVSEWSF